MKARFVTKAALSALTLAFAGTLPGMAQQTASPAAAPAVDQVKASAVERAFMKKMADIVQAGLKAGCSGYEKAVSGVLNDAAKAGVSDHVMGAMVSMAAGAFPSNAPAVASAAVRSYGPGVKEEQVRNVIASAVSSQPHPYASVAPISEAVEKALGNSPVAGTVPSIAVAVAAQTPDNPLSGVTVQEHGLVKPVEDVAEGSLVLPGGLPVGGTPTSPAPVSNPAGN